MRAATASACSDAARAASQARSAAVRSRPARRCSRCPAVEPCFANWLSARLQDQAHLAGIFVSRVELEGDADGLTVRIGPNPEKLNGPRTNGQDGFKVR